LQLYHTKLEQLNTLTNRINTLTRTLGAAYFAPDILQPTPALDEDETSAPLDIKDVTPERFARLEKELVRGKAEVRQRLAALHSTFVHIDWLYAELGMEIPTPSDQPQPSSSSTLSVPAVGLTSRPPSSVGFHVNINSDPFLSTPTPTPLGRGLSVQTGLLFSSISPASTATSSSPPSPNEIDSAHMTVLARFAETYAAAETEGRVLRDGEGLEGVEPTPALLEWSERTLTMLENTKRRREAQIQALYDQLEALWRRLGVSEADMDGFVDAHQGSTEAVVRAYEEELECMLELKRERMGVFVENARQEIEKLWDELMVGEDERADFAPFADGARSFHMY
jgi:Ase1/PRC1/MAP65 family protein